MSTAHRASNLSHIHQPIFSIPEIIMNMHLRWTLLRAALATSCAISLLGCGSPMKQPTFQQEVVSSSYVKHLSLWRPEELRKPVAVAARLDPSKNDFPTAVNTAALERLKIGMSEKDVVDLLANPAARTESGMWQYVARNAQGPYVATLLFNTEQRLWIGATDRAPLNTLRTSPAAMHSDAALPAIITLSAKELFAFGSDVLTLPQPKLDAIAAAMRAQRDPASVLVVNGYTDRLGGRTANDALSQRRAQAVRGYLVHQHVAADRIEAVGKGASNAIVACTGIMPRTALIQCLAPNRRVEIEHQIIEPVSVR
jgi:outer membrane protein OmpA-like peptidoglycan-associated protein